MGLDMYAYTFPAEAVDGEGETDVQVKSIQPEELHYWRKHHNLHGWMQMLYEHKGGQDEQFNCNNVRLHLEDLDELEKTVKEEGAVLPDTVDFFFGDYPPDNEYRKDDLEFIRKAREAIAQGKAVFYDSWW